MTSTPGTSATQTAVRPEPEDFGDDTAFALGPFKGSAGVYGAIERVLVTLDHLNKDFGIAKVQFCFNGTPAVAKVEDSADTVLKDWTERRKAYQRAAGIIA